MKHFLFSFRFAAVMALILAGASNAMAYDVEVEGIYYDLNGDEASVAGINSSSFNTTDVVIPQTINSEGTNYPVTSINAQAFYNQNWITSITIPGTITSSGEKAFYGCSGLSRVNISDLAAWCKIDFNYMVDGYVQAYEYAPYYYGGNPLKEAHHLYLNGEEIVDLVIPESVDSVSYRAFYGCRSLRSVDTGSGAIGIGGDAFLAYDESWNEINLTTVTIGENIQNLGSDYYYWEWKYPQWGFASALPSHIDHLIWKAKSCQYAGFTIWGSPVTSFDELTIDEGVERFPRYVATYCSDLRIVYYNAKNMELMDDDYDYDYPFNYCSGLKKIVIGNQVEAINDNTFYIYDSNIDTVVCYATVPPTITAACFAYQEIYEENDEENYIDKTTYENAVLCVPAGSIQNYQNAEGWKEFLHIVAIAGDVTPGDVDGDGKIGMDDLTALINYLLTDNATGINMENADVDGSGNVGMDDLTALVNYLLTDHW